MLTLLRQHVVISIAADFELFQKLNIGQMGSKIKDSFDNMPDKLKRRRCFDATIKRSCQCTIGCSSRNKKCKCSLNNKPCRAACGCKGVDCNNPFTPRPDGSA